MKEKIIAKIEQIYGYNKNRKIPVVFGEIAGHEKIELIELREKGISCQNCIFKMYNECCLYPHKIVSLDKKYQFDQECIFSENMFEPDEAYRHELDSRMICEFYRFRPVYSKENGVRKWYENDGDELFFQNIPNAFSRFHEKMEHVLKEKEKQIQELEWKLESIQEKVKDMNGFMDFFKSELPMVYKEMRKALKERDCYD